MTGDWWDSWQARLGAEIEAEMRRREREARLQVLDCLCWAVFFVGVAWLVFQLFA